MTTEICMGCSDEIDTDDCDPMAEGWVLEEEGWYCELCDSGWNGIDSDTQDDLIAWYNTRESDLDLTDYRVLARLYHDGNFHAYACGHCGEKVRQGRPDDWADFQGVRQDEGIGQLCADCYGLYERLKDLAEE